MILKDFISFNKKGDLPVFIQIANDFITQIRQGRIKPGMKLPGSREIAQELHVHRNTIMAALEELAAQGWIEMIPRKGTFVASHLPVVNPRKLKVNADAKPYPDRAQFAIQEGDIVQFPPPSVPGKHNLTIDDGFPDLRFVPSDLLLRELRTLSKRPFFRTYLSYGNPLGTDLLRETLEPYLSETRGLAVSTNNIMITRGAQMGIYLASRVLLKPGDHVIVGEPNYFAANLTFQQLGAVLNRVPVDEKGIDVDAIEALCKKKKVRMVYVISHHHLPTTVMLVPERRMQLLELAARYKFAIIEDDYDYDFHYTSNPVLPMASLDHHGSVIYVGTLTKTIAPALRIGFITGPRNFIDTMGRYRKLVDRQGDAFMEAAIAQLYRNGTINRHINKVVKIYHERRDHFCALLEDQLGKRVSFTIPEGGMAVWVKFNANLVNLAARVAKKGLGLSTGKIHNTHNVDYQSTRLGFASLNLKEQEKAVSIIRDCL